MFYNTEIALRKELKYPPFYDIIVIGFTSKNKKRIIDLSNYMYEKLKQQLRNEDLKIFKPMPAPIDKIQNNYRWRMIIKGNMNENINLVINNILKDIFNKNIKDVRIGVDVNPNNMM